MKTVKPTKKTDRELNRLIKEKIESGNYLFLKHAKQRLEERQILDIEVLDILEGAKGFHRTRNKSKDTYETKREDWNYCFEGITCDNAKIRIIISFAEMFMLVITVIRLCEEGN